MAISTRGELISSVSDWLHRSDLSNVIEDYITLCEARLNRNLRVQEMIQRSSTPTIPQDPYLELPDDYLQLQNIEVDASPNFPLKYVTPTVMDRKYRTDAQKQPTAYTLIGNQIQLGLVPDAVYTIEIAYYAKIPALTDANTTNWLLTKYPDIYLYGCLLLGKAYVQDEQRIAIWKAGYDEAIAELKSSDKKAKHSGSGLSMRAT